MHPFFSLDLFDLRNYTLGTNPAMHLTLRDGDFMKYNHDRLMQAKRTVALVSASSVSINQAISVVLSSIGGTVFDVKLKEVDQQAVWRVKLLRASRRVKVYVDASSGHILEAKAESALTEPRGRSEAELSGCRTSLESVSPC